jgi:hypothetical protein
MNTSRNSSLSNLGGFALGMILSLALLLLFVGCADAPRWGAWSSHPSNAQIQAGLGRLDSYVYFPGYEIYHNRTREEYVYRSDQTWITRIEPPGEVPVEMLLASPSVAMSFTDAPARHHAAVLRLYPRNWGRVEAAVASAQ